MCILHVGIRLEVVHRHQISLSSLIRILPLVMVNITVHKGKITVSVEQHLEGMEVIVHNLEALGHHMVQGRGRLTLVNSLGMRDGLLEVTEL